MRTPSFLIFLAVILVLATGIGAVAYITLTPPPGKAPRDRATAESGLATNIQPPPRPVGTSVSPLRGDPTAPITIFEFGDFLCVPCAEVAPVLDKVLEQYPGQVRLIWKDLPNTARHPLAQKAAEAARCAAEQGKFWEYHDALLKQTSQGRSLTEEGLISTAQTIGLTMGDFTPPPERGAEESAVGGFTECLASGRTKDLVDRDTNEAILLRVDATPYFFIDTERFSGAIPETQLKEIIENALKK